MKAALKNIKTKIEAAYIGIQIRPKMAASVLFSIVIGIAFQNCEFTMNNNSADSLASTTALADGVYGVSPTALQLKYSDRSNFTNLIVYSSSGGKDSVLNTNFTTGFISGLTANTPYWLHVKGITANGAQTANVLADYNATTWDTFSHSTWNVVADVSNASALSGSAYKITWTYKPWTRTPAGDGVLAKSFVRCYFTPDRGPSTDPFAPGAKTVEGRLADGSMSVTAGSVSLVGTMRIGCEVTFADDTVSRHSVTQKVVFLPAISKCTQTSVDVYKQYSCPFSDLIGTGNDSSGLTLAIDSSNTCSFITASSTGFSGKPRDPAVGTCTLAYTIQTAGGISPVINQTITVNNVKAIWTKEPGAQTPLREISRDDTGTMTGGNFDETALRSKSNYVLHMEGQYETNKYNEGVRDGAVYGSYKLDSSTSSNCGRLGKYTYLSSNGTYQTGINPYNGDFYFQPFENVYGACTIDVYFDDGHPTNNLSSTISIPLTIRGYNDKPQMNDPGFKTTGAGGNQVFDCGSKCYVGIDYTIPLTANTGGVNSNYPKVSGEPDQKLLLKPGNCIAVNSDPSDTKVYMQIEYCELNPKTEKIVVGFRPVAVPPSNKYVTIQIRVSDNGTPDLASAFNPRSDATNSSCLANNSTCKPYPSTYQDSNTLTIQVAIDAFNLPLQPALIVSKGACMACHLTVTSGDLITDFGNTPAGATGRFSNWFFRDNSFMESWADHVDGYRAMNLMNGTVYTKRARLTSTENAKFFERIGGLTTQSGAAYPSPLSSSPNTVVDLVDFLRSGTWTIDGKRLTNNYSYRPSAFVSYCPRPNVNDDSANPAQCYIPTIRDTIDVNSIAKPINYLTISAPTADDIQAIAKASPGTANAIVWASADADVQPLYLIPADGSRPFSGLASSKMQPQSAVPAGASPQATTNTYITNTGANIQCYGDVVVKGNLFLESPTFVSDSRGCRIHVTGSVLFHAMASTDHNNPAVGMTVVGTGNVGVQITSPVAIVFGMTPDHLSDRGLPWDTQNFATDLKIPSTACQTGPTTFVGYSPKPAAVRSCINDRTYVYDTTDLPTGYKGWSFGYVAYTGLMVNAPTVQGRYQGSFTGSIITDIPLFRLGELHFAFDQRFRGQVPFPRLQTIKSSLGGNPRVIFDAGPCNQDASDSWQCNAAALQ